MGLPVRSANSLRQLYHGRATGVRLIWHAHEARHAQGGAVGGEKNAQLARFHAARQGDGGHGGPERAHDVRGALGRALGGREVRLRQQALYGQDPRVLTPASRRERALAEREEAAQPDRAPELVRRAGEPVQHAATALGSARSLENVQRRTGRANRVHREDLGGVERARIGADAADALEGPELRFPRRRMARCGVEPHLADPADSRKQLAERIGVRGVAHPPGMEPGRKRHVLLASQRGVAGAELVRRHRDGKKAKVLLGGRARHGGGVGKPSQMAVCVNPHARPPPCDDTSRVCSCKLGAGAPGGTRAPGGALRDGAQLAAGAGSVGVAAAQGGRHCPPERPRAILYV